MAAPAIYPVSSSARAAAWPIGGCDAVELAREHGTPAYVMAEDDLRANARAFPPRWPTHHDGPGEVIFASKACPAPRSCASSPRRGWASTSPRAASCTSRCKAGFDPARIYLHGNAKSAEELRLAVEAGVGCDRDRQRRRRRQARRVARPRAPASACCCASRPGVDADTHAAILTGHAESKFGIEPRRRPRARQRPARPPRRPGFHFHLGSQLVDLDPVPRGGRRARRPRRPPVYSLGGGFAVAYTADDRAARRSEASVAAVVEAAREALGPGKHLVLEPGRSLVANAGVTLYTVRVGQGRCRAAAGSSPSTAACRTTCGPMLYDAVYDVRGGRPASTPRASPPPSSASTASPATCSCATHPLPRPAARRRARHGRHGRLRPRHGLQLQRHPPPARRVLPRTGRRGSSCAARPTRI